LRATGVNLIVTTLRQETITFWNRADRDGFLILGRIVADDGTAWESVTALADHPSCGGWLVPQALLTDAALWGHLLHGPRRPLVGVELSDAMSQPLPTGIAFIAGPPDLLDTVTSIQLPKLVLSRDTERNGTGPSPNHFGHVHPE
jgi:hypothetical protein